MDLVQIETFLILAEELHFGRTAERLYLSQPRVSRIVVSLEREVGGVLFERTSRSVRLTPLGVRFRDRLQAAYTQLNAAVDDARAAAREAAGLLRIGFTATTGGQALTRVVRAFEDRYPYCEVILQEVVLFDPFAPLRGGEIDVVVNWLAIAEPDLTAGPAIEHRDRVLAVAADHPLAARESVSVEDLADYEVALLPPPFPQALYEALVPWRTPSGRAVRRAHRAVNIHELISLIARGHIVHPTMADVPVFRRDDIVLVPFRDSPQVGLGLIWCTAHQNARILALADVARALRGPVCVTPDPRREP